MAWLRVKRIFFAQASNNFNVSAGKRALTAGSIPVAGRPGFLFLSTDIDAGIIRVYRNKRTEQVRSTLARP